MQIKLTLKDYEKHLPWNDTKTYRRHFSASGTLIDELAYCAKQWTQDELHDNNYEYELSVPYDYNYEEDLFEATKTSEQLYALAQTIDVSLNANWERIAKEQKLQAGACVALNNEQEWQTLLTAYKEKLQEDRTEGISNTYNEQLQKEIDSYWDDLYREWLYGDHKNFSGVVYEIAKYFTNNRDGEYNKKDDEYTFILDEYDIETAKDEGYNKRQLKAWLLDKIISSGNARKYKEEEESKKRKAERERVTQYKKEQAEKEAEERKQKLLSMTIK